MVGLIDITPSVETIDVRGHKAEVKGLSIKSIGALFLRFPDIRRMMETNSWEAAELLRLSDEAIAAIIAQAASDVLTEESAGHLTLGEKAEFLTVILRLTMPRGPGPFVDLMRAVGLLEADAAQSAKVPATTSAARSKS